MPTDQHLATDRALRGLRLPGSAPVSPACVGQHLRDDVALEALFAHRQPEVPILDAARKHREPAGRFERRAAVHHDAGRKRVLEEHERLDDSERLRERSRESGLPRIRYLPLWAFRTALPVLNAVSNEKARRALGNLDLFLAYLREQQSFANEHTRRVLEAEGIPLPGWSSYLDSVLDYYEQRQRDAANHRGQPLSDTVRNAH